MWISESYRTVADVEISSIAAALDQLTSADWDAHEQVRQEVTGGRQTSAIFFRSIYTRDFVESLQQRPLLQDDVTEHDAPAELRREVDRVVERVLAHFPVGGVVTRLQLARLAPGAKIEPHVDSSPMLASTHRIHVPITTHPQVSFRVRGEAAPMSVGKAYELNNRLEHSVANSGDRERIHLIIDYLEPAHNHPRVLSPSFERRRMQEAEQRRSPLPAVRTGVALPRVVATSVVRGAHQNESHGGVYLVDMQTGTSEQMVDWNTCDIDWGGRGADRGLRGVAFDWPHIYIAASDELYCFDSSFRVAASYRNPYLKHAHEIVRHGRHLFVTSTGFDSVLRFDLDANVFDQAWLLRIQPPRGLNVRTYDPRTDQGPVLGNTAHLNTVYRDDTGLYVGGRRLRSLVHLANGKLGQYGQLPLGTHNARPWQGGLLFNDTDSDLVVFQTPKQFRSVEVPRYAPHQLEHTDKGDDKLARQAFGRGLCVYGDDIVLAGSSPSTITAIDLIACAPIKSVNLTMDIRNAIHGLEIWPK